MDMNDSVKRATAMATELRHELHLHPELPWCEVETTKKVAAKLKELGVPVIKMGFKGTQCGLIAEIKGAKPGPVLMVRADIDALPVTENEDLLFASRYPESAFPVDLPEVSRVKNSAAEDLFGGAGVFVISLHHNIAFYHNLVINYIYIHITTDLSHATIAFIRIAIHCHHRRTFCNSISN